MYQKLIFWNFLPFVIMYSSKDLICCLTSLILLKSSWWPVWTVSAQTHLNFQKNLLNVEIRKEHKKIISGPSKIFKNISWHINICLKYFMNPAKTLRSLSYILNGRSLRPFFAEHFQATASEWLLDFGYYNQTIRRLFPNLHQPSELQ